ncbi:MAG TPA: hypothetical protein VL359_11110 [bacterium]|nr:hypothetical protein [bacterium]
MILRARTRESARLVHTGRPGRRLPRAAARAALLAALLPGLLGGLLLPWCAHAQGNPLQTVPPALESDRPRRPLVPAAIINPESTVEVGVGPHFLTVKSDKLQLNQQGGDAFSDGADFSLDWVHGGLRLGYERQLLRVAVPATTTYLGSTLNFLAMDADQFWAFEGWRPSRNWYLAAGVGLEYRLLRLEQSGSRVATVTESLPVGALMADWYFAPPIAVQLRAYQEEGGHLLTLSGYTVLLSYLVPY